MGDRQSEVGDARLEVVHEAGGRVGELSAVVGAEAFGELAGDLAARGLVSGRRAGLELGPPIFRHLGRKVAHPVRQAALAGRAREAHLDSFDDTRRTITDDQQGIAEAARPHVLEERGDRLGVLLRAGHQVEEHLAAVEGEPPGGQDRLAPLPERIRSAIPSMNRSRCRTQRDRGS